jgi:hypothetical protein
VVSGKGAEKKSGAGSTVDPRPRILAKICSDFMTFCYDLGETRSNCFHSKPTCGLIKRWLQRLVHHVYGHYIDNHDQFLRYLQHPFEKDILTFSLESSQTQCLSSIHNVRNSQFGAQCRTKCDPAHIYTSSRPQTSRRRFKISQADTCQPESRGRHE